MDFDNKVVLITGAVGSIGRGVADRFCELGATVFITDLDQIKLDLFCKELTHKGGRCLALAADIVDYNQVKQVVDRTVKTCGGKIDILVNVAGYVAQSKVEEIEERDWDHIFAVNCKGTFLFIKEVVPIMKKRGSGKIINFSSKSGKTGSALLAHYSAAKAAIIGLTQALAYELADSGINVNCVCPGITENTGVWDSVSSGYIKNLKLSRDEVVKKFSSKVPLKRLAKIKDVVEVTVFLASSGADYMTGQAINITGGRETH